MKTGHLFAGAGGGLLADLILGHRPVFAVEWEEYPARILQQRADDGWFPGLRVHHTDIRLFDPSQYQGCVDSIHAGFPCQDISVAGEGAGIDGERSGLWSEVVRVAGILRPKELFLENSPAITSRGLGRVLGDLSSLGYDAQWCVIRASNVGAQHLRARWWCLARNVPDTNSAGQQSGSRRRCCGNTPEARDDARGICQDVPDTIRLEDISEGRAAERPVYRSSDGSNRGSRSTKSYLGCMADGLADDLVQWWEEEPGVGRTTDGMKDRARMLQALGNGQVPLQAALAYKILSEGWE